LLQEVQFPLQEEELPQEQPPRLRTTRTNAAMNQRSTAASSSQERIFIVSLP